MFRRVLSVAFPQGLHVGPGYELARRAKAWPCAVSIRTPRGAFDAKSGLKVLQAGVGPGGSLELLCQGEREDEAGEALSAWLTGRTD